MLALIIVLSLRDNITLEFVVVLVLMSIWKLSADLILIIILWQNIYGFDFGALLLKSQIIVLNRCLLFLIIFRSLYS